MILNNYFTSTKDESPLELIWTNHNPTNAFSQQVLTLPTGFTAFAIEFLWSTSPSTITPAIVCIPFFEESRFYNAITTTYTVNDNNPQREIKYARDGSISFGNAIAKQTVENDRAIPQRIWGLRFSV